MAFPIKNYLYIQEVSKRWHRNVKDVEYCIENGLTQSKTTKVCGIFVFSV